MLRKGQTIRLTDPSNFYVGRLAEIHYITTFENGSTPIITWIIRGPESGSSTTGTTIPKHVAHPFTLDGLKKFIIQDFEQVDEIEGYAQIETFLAPIMDGWGGCESELVEADDPEAYLEWIDLAVSQSAVGDRLIDADPTELQKLYEVASEIYVHDTK